MPNYLSFQKIKHTITYHKFLSSVIAIVVASTAYFGYSFFIKSPIPVRYVTAQVEKGTVVSSISGSGQVSSLNQVDVKPKASGEILYVTSRGGEWVDSGTTLVQLDTRDAEKAVRDAQANLEGAQLSLEKLKKPADALSLLEAENALASAKESKNKAVDDLTKAYDDGFTEVTNAFLNLPTAMTGVQDILYGTTLSSGSSQSNIAYYADAVKNYDTKVEQYKTDAATNYDTARASYDQNFRDYKAASRFSNTQTIETLINETYNTTKQISEALKSANSLIQFYKDKLTEHNITPSATADTHLSSLSTYTDKTNTSLSSLLSITRTMQTDKEAITQGDRSIKEKEGTLANLKDGADPLDIKEQELTVTQRENALRDAKEKLSDYTVQAPFGGILAKVTAKKGDTASVGTAVATMVTREHLAEISLNEVDVAKVKIGQKATLTFDAVPDLSIAGEVAEIDTIGTVTQGVVTYLVKIKFDTQDTQIKPGMSVSASIITDVKQDVLYVPNSAIKEQGGESYVEVMQGASTVPERKTVQVGLANDTITEIVSGLSQGDNVVTQTITSTAATAQTQSQQNSGIRIPGLTGGGGGGGNFRGVTGGR